MPCRLVYIDDSALLQNQSRHSIVNLACAHPKYNIVQFNTLSNWKSLYFKTKTQSVKFVAIKSVLIGGFKKRKHMAK